MKTIAHFMTLFFMIVSVTSCETDIPETDIEPPQFSFQIRGDGFDHTFDQDTDFTSFQLNLRRNAHYDFLLLASDRGGLASMAWELAAFQNYEFENPIEIPWTSTQISQLTRRIEWRGDATNPLTGTILGGDFQVTGPNIRASIFRFEAEDFGGRDGAPNTFFGELEIYIGDHDTEIIEHSSR